MAYTGLYNADGQILTTQVNGSVYTGLYSPDGNWNIVINDGSVYKGRYHPCGALNAVVVSDPYAPSMAANGGINVVGNSSGGYSPTPLTGTGASVAPTIPVLAMAPTWTSADATPDFTISFSTINLVAGDTIRLQIQLAGGTWLSPVTDVTHTITSAELAAGEVDLVTTPLGNANYEARANTTHTVTSAWSNTVAFTVLVTNDLRFWFDGLPLNNLASSSAPTGGLKYWFDGLPTSFIG